MSPVKNGGITAAPVIASLSKMVPDPELRVSYNQELADTYPPGSGADDLAGIFENADRSEDLNQILRDGEALGLDTDEALARLEAGGTKNHGLAQEWVDRDLTAILAKDGIELTEASSEQLDAAVERLDGFQMRLASELGVEMESAFTVLEQGEYDHNLEQAQMEDARDTLLAETGRADGIQLAEDQGITDAGAIASFEENETPNAYIRQLAQELREGELSEEQQDALQRTLVAELHKELGDEGLAELDRGHWEVLDDVLPSKVDQISVTQEYLEAASEDRGAPELAEIASDLQQVKASERAKEISAEMGRDRGLDDDMGL